MSLQNKVAIVTGASRGLGLAIAVACRNAGMIVYDLSSSGEGVAIRCDVRNESEVAAAVADVYAREQRIDLLINNAGVGYFSPLEEYTAEQCRQIFEVNVFGVFHFCKHVVPYMKRQRSGMILNIASDVARRTFAGGSLYVASKYAVQGLSGSLSQELRPFGVRVGTLNPGLIDTWFAGSTQGDEDKAGHLRPESLADLIVYLASAPAQINFDEIVVHPLSQDYSLS